MIGKSITNVVCETGKTGAVSQAINLAINNPTLWGFMRARARKTMIKTAESSGIPWRQAVEELRNMPEVRFQIIEQMMFFPASKMTRSHQMLHLMRCARASLMPQR